MTTLKYSIAFLFFVLASSSVIAQQSKRYGFELREYLKTAEADEKIPLLVEGNEHQIKQITEQLGGEIRLQFQSLFSLEIPARYIDVFAESAGIQNIEFSTSPGITLNDTMLIHTNVDSIIQQAAPLRQAYTGKGVILGVIDSGIELAHPDFQDSTGKTRVLYVWDQKQAFNPAQQALNYNYGIEWDSAAINAGNSTHDDMASEFGHGSNVTGAAASNGLAPGQFRGVAPEVNIISVATDFNRPNWLQTVAESVDYIFKKADALGMPCVINASIGTYVGSHDGKDIAARIIAGLIQQKSGRSFVCANGNAGTQRFHVQQSPVNDTAFTWFQSAPAQWAGLGGLYYEVWSDTADFRNLQFSIGADKKLNGVYSFKGRTPFSGIQNRLNTLFYDTLRDPMGNRIATIETYAEQNQGRYKLEIALIDPDSAQFLFRFETKGTGKIDIYSSFSFFRHSNMVNAALPTVQQYPPIRKYSRPDSLQTMVSSFTCSPSVISVGNHYNRRIYTDVNGIVRNMGITPGRISLNSSLGPNRLNDLKPDVSSAGDFMFSSGRLATIRSLLNLNPGKISPDTMHWRNGGTSMASPTVAGMVALYLQMCPNATQSQIISDLLSSAKKDQFTGAQNNFTYGNGKADGFNFLKQKVFYPSLATTLPNLCDGDSVALSLSPNYSSYLWNTGDTVSSIQALQSDNYYATVENQFGCTAITDTLNLQFNPLPAKPSISRSGNILSISPNGSYQWYFNNSQLLGSMSSSVLAQASGSYFCSFTDNNGCNINSDTVNIIVTGIEELNPKTLSIQPNPSNGIVKITTESDFNIEKIDLFDLAGKLVWSENIKYTGQQFSLNLSPINKGIYLLRAYSSKGMIQKKIMIE